MKKMKFLTKIINNLKQAPHLLILLILVIINIFLNSWYITSISVLLVLYPLLKLLYNTIHDRISFRNKTEKEKRIILINYYVEKNNNKIILSKHDVLYDIKFIILNNITLEIKSISKDYIDCNTRYTKLKRTDRIPENNRYLLSSFNDDIIYKITLYLFKFDFTKQQQNNEIKN